MAQIREVKAPVLDPQSVQLHTPWWSRFATSGALYAYRRRREAKEHEKQAKLLASRVQASLRLRHRKEDELYRLRIFGDAEGRAGLRERLREFFGAEDQPDALSATRATADQLAAYRDYRSLLDVVARSRATELLSNLEAALAAGADDKTAPRVLAYRKPAVAVPVE